MDFEAAPPPHQSLACASRNTASLILPGPPQCVQLPLAFAESACKQTIHVLSGFRPYVSSLKNFTKQRGSLLELCAMQQPSTTKLECGTVLSILIACAGVQHASKFKCPVKHYSKYTTSPIDMHAPRHCNLTWAQCHRIQASPNFPYI